MTSKAPVLAHAGMRHLRTWFYEVHSNIHRALFLWRACAREVQGGVEDQAARVERMTETPAFPRAAKPIPTSLDLNVCI